MTVDQKAVAILTALFLLIYVPVTYIMFRNVTFRAPLKYAFCFSVVPLFIALLVVSIWFANEYLAAFVALQGLAKDFGGMRGEAMWAFLLFIPMPALGGWLWYLLFRFLDKVLGQARNTRAIT